MAVLTEGAELHPSIEKLAHAFDIKVATFEMLGGLTEIEFSAYDFVNQVRLPSLSFALPMEIVSGHGTISQLDDAPHIHIHLVTAFRDESAPNGIAVVAGHVARAAAFAVEITFHVYDGHVVTRKLHPVSGLRLWDLPELK